MVTVVYLWLNVSKYGLHLIRVYLVHIYLWLCVVLLPLPHRDDLGMVYVYEYVLISCM